MISLFLFCALSVADEVGALPEEAEAAALPDRSQRPVVRPSVPLELPTPTVHSLSDGVEVWHVRVPSVRHVEIRAIFFRGAHHLAPELSHTPGVMAWLQDVETSDFDAVSLQQFEDLHELDVSSGLNTETGEVSAEVPRYHLEKAFTLMESVLKRPTFPKKDLKLHLRDTLVNYEDVAPNDGRVLASRVLGFATYGADHPYGKRPDLAELRMIKPDTLAALHGKWLESAPVRVLVVGDVDYAEVETGLTRVFEGVGAAGEPFQSPAVDALEGKRVFAVDLEGAEQTRIALRMNAPLQDDPDRPVATLVNFSLGGNFLSRLNTNLREDKGFTYGIGSSYRWWRNRAWWDVGVEVAAENTAAAIVEIQRELTRMAGGGLTDDELSGGRNSEIADWNNVLETAGSAASHYGALIYDDLTISGELEVLRRYSSISPDDTKRVSAKYLAEDSPRLWAIVGDRAKIESQLTDELGWSLIWITPEEAVLGTF